MQYYKIIKNPFLFFSKLLIKSVTEHKIQKKVFTKLDTKKYPKTKKCHKV